MKPVLLHPGLEQVRPSEPMLIPIGSLSGWNTKAPNQPQQSEPLVIKAPGGYQLVALYGEGRRNDDSPRVKLHEGGLMSVRKDPSFCTLQGGPSPSRYLVNATQARTNENRPE